MTSLTAATHNLLADLSRAGRHAVDRGLVLASGGNLSARLDDEGSFVVTASGAWLDRLGPDDFTVIGLDGEPRQGNPRPSVEWKLHHRTYLVRPDVRAVVHLHPEFAVLVDALGHEIRCLTLDHAFYLKEVARVPFYPAGSTEIADAAATAAREHDAIVMAHHGCSALGGSVDMALRRALNLESAATATYRMLLLGNTDLRFPDGWSDRLVTV